MKKINKTVCINRVSIGIYLLFFPVFWAVKKYNKYRFERLKASKIKEADKRHKQSGKQVCVVQIEKDFIVGTREELRRYDKIGGKVVKKLTKSHLLDFDYRKAIIYTAK